jgi:hypothetical protein
VLTNSTRDVAEVFFSWILEHLHRGRLLPLRDDRIEDLSGVSEHVDPLLRRSARLRGAHHRGRRRVLLGLDEDTQLLAYFRRHYAHFFPNLLRVHRTTFARRRQLTCGRPKSSSGTNSCLRHLTIPPSPWRTLFPCRRACSPAPTAASASKGRPLSARIPSSSRLSLRLQGTRYRVCWPGVITRFFSVAPANAHELSVVPDLLSRIPGAWWSGTATTARLRLGRNWPGGASSWRPPTGPRSATHVPR